MALLGAAAVATVSGYAVAWKVTSDENFDRLKPVKNGQAYKVGVHRFVIPQRIRLVGKGYILKESFMRRQYELLNAVGTLMHTAGIEFWCAGGTSLGIARHGGLIPWDDDCDIHIDWAWKPVVFSKGFAALAAKYNLQPFKMLLQNPEKATRNDAAIRIRFLDDAMPVCDVFFVTEVKGPHGHPHVQKIDGWDKNGGLRLNSKERWPREYIFPLRKYGKRGLDTMIANQPVHLAMQQYGADALLNAYVIPPALSHSFPFRCLPWLWKHT